MSIGETGTAWLAEVEDKEMDMLGDVDSDSEGRKRRKQIALAKYQLIISSHSWQIRN